MGQVGGWRWAVLATFVSFSGLAQAGTVPGETSTPRAAMMRIAVAHGRATFTLPATGRDETTLVVVSALSHGPGPFPVRLRAAISSVSGPDAIVSAAPAPSRFPVVSRLREPIPGPGPAPSPMRTFWLMVREGDPSSPGNYLPVRARLRAVGTRCQVYVDERDTDAVPEDLARDVVETFDRTIYPAASRSLGTARDIDGDGRLTVLVTGWLARMGTGRLAVDGLFRGADMDRTLEPPFGNRCDMVYLSAGVAPGPHLRTVLAHEYVHALTFSQKATAARGRIIEEEGWLDEGISHLAEDWYGFSRSNLDDRVEAFLAAPERYRLLVPDYYAVNLYRSQGHRGCTYSFLRWCGQRYGIEPLLMRLVRSPLIGVANLEAATGEPFEELFRAWSVALFLEGIHPRDDWPLAGPRPAWITPGGPAECWEAAGTSCHHVLIASRESVPTRVEVTGPPEADLQVTAVPLPVCLPSVELRVSPIDGDNGMPCVRLSVRERSGPPVRLEELTWQPQDGRAPSSARGRLGSEQLARALGRNRLEASDHLVSLPVLLHPDATEDTSLLFKLAGRDLAGRRIIARAELPNSSPTHRQLAGFDGDESRRR